MPSSPSTGPPATSMWRSIPGATPRPRRAFSSASSPTSPIAVHTILTDNGAEFTDRFAVDMKDKPHDRPSGNHPFDLVCAKRNIDHRLTRPYRPQTNGLVERFNRRIVEAIGREPNAASPTAPLPPMPTAMSSSTASSTTTIEPASNALATWRRSRPSPISRDQTRTQGPIATASAFPGRCAMRRESGVVRC